MKREITVHNTVWHLSLSLSTVCPTWFYISINHLGLSVWDVTDLSTPCIFSHSSHTFYLYLLQPSPPDTPRCCSAAAWVRSTQRHNHKQVVKRCELQANSVIYYAGLSLRPQSWRNRALHGQAHNICEDYFCQAKLKKALTSQMTSKETASANMLYFSTEIKEYLLWGFITAGIKYVARTHIVCLCEDAGWLLFVCFVSFTVWINIHV